MFKELAHSVMDTMEEIVYFLIGLFVTGVIIGELYMVWAFKLPLPQDLMAPFWFPIYAMIVLILLKQIDNMQEKAAAPEE
ncbi:MAG: hypothetical protein KAS30_00750 [Candidatus Diapherotrites archaeon]|nr:hypothetical protein [Candidatus Diapherotrites archaeon]